MLIVFGEMREGRGRAVLLFGSTKWQGRFPGGAPCGLAEMGFSGGIGKVGLLITLDQRLIRGGSAAESRWIGRRSWERWDADCESREGIGAFAAFGFRGIWLKWFDLWRGLLVF